MARCQKCGTVPPAMARFCPICGSAVGAATPTPPAPTPPTYGKTPPARPAVPTNAYAPSVAPNNGNRTALMVGGGILALGVAGLLLAKNFGVLGAKSVQTPTGTVMNAPSTQAASGVLQAPNTQAQAPVMAAPEVKAPQAPVVAPPNNPGAPMPEDVIEYLRWLKKFDKALQDLHAQLGAIAMSSITSTYMGAIQQITGDEDSQQQQGPNPNDMTVKLSQITQQLNNSAAMFQQKQPPNACAELATAYRNALTMEVQQVSSMITMINEIVQSFSATDVNAGAADRQSKLTGLMQQMSSKGMSQDADAMVMNADRALNTLRSYYTNIPQDVDNGAFQLRPLNTGMDPSKLLGGLGSGMGGGGLGM